MSAAAPALAPALLLNRVRAGKHEEGTVVAAAGIHRIPPVSRTGLAVSLLSAPAGLRAVDLPQQAIAPLPPGADETQLRLASLEYIDVAATRELVTLAARPPMPRLPLGYPPSVVLRLLQLCWPAAQARMDIGAGTVARLHMRLGQPARQLQTSPGQSSAECY